MKNTKYEIEEPLIPDYNNILLYLLNKSNYLIPKINLEAPLHSIYPENIQEISYNTFIQNDDFNLFDNEEINLNEEINNIIEDSSQIINKNEINEDDLDNQFNEFIDVCVNIIQSIITTMIEIGKWNFNPIKKFVWIYLILSCKYEIRAIKYIQKSPFYKKSLFTKKDRYGFSPLFNLLTNQNEIDDTILDEIDVNNLETIYFNNYNLLIYSTKNKNNFIKLLDKYANIKNILKIKNENGLTPFLSGCIANPDLVKELLKHPLFDEEIFNQTFESMTCLMISLLYNEHLFDILYYSKYCKHTLIRKVHPQFGNILNIVVKNQQRELLITLLNSQYADENFLNGISKYSSGFKTNIFLESLKDKNINDIIINHKSFTKNMIADNIFYENNDIYQEINIKNCLTFDHNLIKRLLQKKLIDKRDILTTDKKGLNILLISVFYKKNLLEIIYNSHLWCSDFLFEKYFNKNLIMLLCITHNYKMLDIIFNEKDYEDLLLEKDNKNINTYCYLCKYYSTLAIKLFNPIYLEDIFNDKISMIRPVLYNVNNYILEETIFNSFKENIKILEELDSQNNNLAMELVYDKNLLIKKLIKKNLILKTMLLNKNLKYENFLFILLKSKLDKQDKQFILENISPLIDDERILNIKNKNHENILHLICKNSSINFNIIYSLKNISLRLFEQKDLFGFNSFGICCKFGKTKILQRLLEDKIFGEKDFNQTDSKNIPFVFYGIFKKKKTADYLINNLYMNEKLLEKCFDLYIKQQEIDEDILEIFVHSDLFNETMLSFTNFSNQNILFILAIKNKFNLIERILNKKINYVIALNQLDIEKKHLLYYITNLNLFRKILKNKDFKKSTLSNIDKNNNNIITFFKNDLSRTVFLKEILNSKKIAKSDLMHISNDNEPLFNNIFRYDLELIQSIINLDEVNMNDLGTSDNNGNTCLHKLAITIVNTENEEDKKNLFDKFEKFLKLKIKSFVLTNDFFEMKDENGDTFIYLSPQLLSIYSNSPFFRESILFLENKKRDTIIRKIIFEHSEILVDLMKNKNISKNLLTNKIFTFNLSENKTLPVICYAACIDNNKSLDVILESSLCNDDIINMKNTEEMPVIYYSIIFNKYFTTNILILSKYNLKDSFKIRDNRGRNLLMIAIITNIKIFELIIKSSYLTLELLEDKDCFNYNIITYIIHRDKELLNIIIKSKYWNDNLLINDIDNDNLLIQNYDNIENIKFLLENNLFDIKKVMTKNNYDRTCAHYFCQYNSSAFNYLLNSGKCTEEILLIKDKEGNNCLHLACKETMTDNILFYMNSKLLSTNISLQKNSKGQNIIMLMSKINGKLAYKLYKKTQEAIKEQDNKNNNLFMYACKYNNIPLFKKIIRQAKKNGTEDLINLLGKRNNKNKTVHFISCKYSPKCLEILLNLEETSNDMLSHNHNEYKSCLIIAAKHQTSALKLLLEWDKLDRKTFFYCHKKENVLSIACRHNPEAVKILIESKYDLNELIDDYNQLKIACIYQPIALKYILESKYYTFEMLDKNDIIIKLIEDAYDNQPMSLKILMKCPLLKDQNLLDIEDYKGYKLKFRINKIFPEFNAEEDIEKIKICDFFNEVANENEKKCDICYNYKPKVLFPNCFHFCCLSCSFKINNCHICRKYINNRIIIE